MILSWDIGIKNLSYCILSEDTTTTLDEQQNTKQNTRQKKNATTTTNQIHLNNRTFNIHHWDVIDLVDELENGNDNDNDNLPPLSSSSTSTLTSTPVIKRFSDRFKIICGHEKCKKVARYCHHIPNPNKENTFDGLCLNHYNKLDETSKNKKTDYFFIGHKTPMCLVEDCKRKATFILEEHHYKTYCTIHQKQLVKKCPTVKTLPMEKKIKATHINLNKLSYVLFKELDKLEFLFNKEITNVLLENQPVLKNPTMKTMQIFLYSYFILRGKIDKRYPIIVNCYSANQKNTLSKYLDDNSQQNIKTVLDKVKSKYTKNKKEAVMIVESLMKTDTNSNININTYGDWFNSHKKKDDLSDSLLMNVHYLMKTNAKTKTKTKT